MDLETLEGEYRLGLPLAEQFGIELARQLEVLIAERQIALGFPLQHRVKQWTSLVQKTQQRGLSIKNITDVVDLIGLRVILLFQRDVDAVCEIIRSQFNILEEENTAKRLNAGEFGYSSVHFVAADRVVGNTHFATIRKA
jgi:putative GTP pyrophosphokinase